MICLRKKNKILSRQMNLVLSYEKEGFEDLHLLDSRLATVEQAASSKLLQYVHRDPDEGIEPPQNLLSAMNQGFLADGLCDQG